MPVTFTPSLSERKQILHKLCKTQSTWKVRMGISVFLFIASAGILLADVCLLLRHPTSAEGVFLFLAAGFYIACVPFFSAVSLKNTAKYKCGLPYSSYANGTLVLTPDTLEYRFWRVGPREPAAYGSRRAVYRAEDQFSYRIQKSEILSVRFENSICFITGRGSVEMPRWAAEDEYVRRILPEFSFLLSFEQGSTSQMIQQWRK